MGSRLYSRREVSLLLEAAGLDLVSDTHDFVLPYGFYRNLPSSVADPFRQLDERVGKTSLGDFFASVSYWNTYVENNA
jgi:hypothetical protein